MSDSYKVCLASLVLMGAVWGLADFAGASEGDCRTKGQEADVHISDLRPTQPNVGLGEVKKKAKKLQDADPNRGSLDDGEPVPVVVGPDHALYVSDHHHFVLALNLAHPNALVHIQILENKSCKSCSPSNDKCTREFWTHMVSKHLAYLCNAEDQPIAFTALPPSFDLNASPALQNDPYRTLVNVMRKTPPTGSSKPCVVRPAGNTGAFFWEFRMAEKVRRNIPKDQATALIDKFSDTTDIPQDIIDAACIAVKKDSSDKSCAQTIAAHPSLVVPPVHATGVK